jgi:hypothetical protein
MLTCEVKSSMKQMGNKTEKRTQKPVIIIGDEWKKAQRKPEN